LDEKRKIGEVEFIIDVDKRRPSDKRLWAPLLPWNCETLVERIIEEFGVKAIIHVGGIFREELWVF
jgi:hypothetical protein